MRKSPTLVDVAQQPVMHDPQNSRAAAAPYSQVVTTRTEGAVLRSSKTDFCLMLPGKAA